MPPKPSDSDLPEDIGDERYRALCERRMAEGQLLDGLCISGRRGGTAILPAHARKNSDVARALGVTACIIAAGEDEEVKERELRNPRNIPIMEYVPNQAADFWSKVELYSAEHVDDGAARLFGIVSAEHLDDLERTRREVLGDEPSIDRMRAMGTPLYVYVSDPATFPDLLERYERMEVHGFVLRDRSLIGPIHAAWQAHLNKQETPSLHERPFIGVQGSSEDLTQLMESTEEHDMNIDTLVFTDEPTQDAAEHIQELHLKRMQTLKTSKKLENPYAKPNARERVVIAIVNVQGGARRDAIALLEASQHVDFDVEVHLVENADQLRSVNVNAIVLPGGWHGIQYNLQRELGLNEEIVKHLHENRHLLAVCAGSILARRADNESSPVKSKGCRDGTSFGVGDFSVENNHINVPKDVHIRLHAGRFDEHGNEEDPKSMVLPQVPFSNAPHFIGIDRETLDIIARLVHEEHPSDIEEDDGGLVVGVQLKQREGHADPVLMAASFHDRILYFMFLHELGLFNMRERNRGKEILQRLSYRKREIQVLREESNGGNGEEK